MIHPISSDRDRERSRLGITESLTLALKLKAEVERVCTLLDEKDARIVALETQLARRCSCERCMMSSTNCPADQTDCVAELQQRITAIESELAAKGREVQEMADIWNAEGVAGANSTFRNCASELTGLAIARETSEARLPDLRAALAATGLDRDRERSRREALEREVRELASAWESSTDIRSLRWLANDLRALLDRAAKDSTGSVPTDEVPETSIGITPGTPLAPEVGKTRASEPRRDYLDGAYAPPQPDDLPTGWLKRGLKSAEQDEPHTPDAEPDEIPADHRFKLDPGPGREVCVSVSEAHLAGLQDELEAARTTTLRELRGNPIYKPGQLGLSIAGETSRARLPDLQAALEASGILDRSAEQDEPVGKVKIGWICSKQCSWADRSACFERYVGDPCPHCKSPIVDLLGEPAVAEQDEPHTPDAEPIEVYPCDSCCKPLSEKESKVYRQCDACWARQWAQRYEPRMSVSEAHLNGLLREERAKGVDACANILRRRGKGMWHVLRDYAAAVRRGEA